MRNSTLGTLGKLGGVATFFLTSLDYRVAARNARGGENRGAPRERFLICSPASLPEFDP